jgi:prophage regulatory protein
MYLSSSTKLNRRTMNRVLRLPDVKKNTGLAKSTIYKKIAAKEFPKPISLGIKSVGWLEHDINSWIESRINLSANDNK